MEIKVGRWIVSPAVDQESTVSISCTDAIPYSIELGLGNGAGVSDPTARKLSKYSFTITYGIYQNPARNLPWGDAPTNYVDGTGTGSPQTVRPTAEFTRSRQFHPRGSMSIPPSSQLGVEAEWSALIHAKNGNRLSVLRFIRTSPDHAKCIFCYGVSDACQ